MEHLHLTEQTELGSSSPIGNGLEGDGTDISVEDDKGKAIIFFIIFTYIWTLSMITNSGFPKYTQ